MTNFTELPAPKQMPLFEIITVHCIFGRCKHIVQSTDPEEAHKLMEQHYTATHAARIAAMTGGSPSESSLQQEREAFCAQHGHIFFTNHPNFVTTENKRCTMCGALNPRKHKGKAGGVR